MEGKKHGQDVRHTIWYPHSLISSGNERLEAFKKFGTTTIAVALPAMAGAKLILKNATEDGVIAPECLDPVEYLKEMASLGWPVSFNEKIEKVSSIR